MKIYEARLILRMFDEEKHVVKFTFKELKSDYEYNDKTNEYVENIVGCIRDRVSSVPKYTTYYDSIHKITQGFDRQLSELELKELEINFKKMMKDELQKDFEKQKQILVEQIKALNLDDNNRNTVENSISGLRAISNPVDDCCNLNEQNIEQIVKEIENEI